MTIYSPVRRQLADRRAVSRFTGRVRLTGRCGRRSSVRRRKGKEGGTRKDKSLPLRLAILQQMRAITISLPTLSQCNAAHNVRTRYAYTRYAQSSSQQRKVNAALTVPSNPPRRRSFLGAHCPPFDERRERDAANFIKGIYFVDFQTTQGTTKLDESTGLASR